ncbi:MAG: LysE/ArgO family amino acid transporter, partial [bacterium]
MSAFYAGFSLGLSLIIAIGAQNAFVLKQGVRREHVFMVCALCAVSDALLIALGVSGFYLLVAKFPSIEVVAKYGGAAFLLAYGARSFAAALRRAPASAEAVAVGGSALATASVCLAFTWLNPHVYLDTVVLLGSVSTQYADGKMAFALGAMSASFAFFFALGYGAAVLAPVFAKPNAWRILDALVGAV